MVAYYLDTSALLKRYLVEMGSGWLRRTLAPAHELVIVTTRLLVVELISALNRRVREGTVTTHDYMRLSGRFRDDCRSAYHLIALDDAIISMACALLERHPLRAYDAVHLATALTVHQLLAREEGVDFVFLSADDRLNNAASAEGLAVDNPNHYP
jgi:predicted nucleic acid-binding protein